MSGFITILLMSAMLGATSFGIGMLPLFFTFSKARIAYLSTLGTGLLLGAALGIIIPEGVETLVSSTSSDPAPKIALSLISGFAFMLIVERLTSGHAHAHSHKITHSPLPNHAPPPESLRPQLANRGPSAGNLNQQGEEEYDLSLAELEGAEGPANGSDVAHPLLKRSDSQAGTGVDRSRAFPMTLGLVMHSLADGLALGASALPRKSEGDGEAQNNSQLSLVVFLALIIHKAPTALALSMSLLSSLPPDECKKHLAAFSISTPLGALAAFGLLTLAGAGSGGDWPGIALLISGGTFLYVATVLQPVSHQEGRGSSTSEIDEKVRVGLIILGMFIPFLISLVAGHEH